MRHRAKPLTGSPEQIVAGLHAFAAQGIDHLQLYLVPNTPRSIEAFAPTLALYRRNSPA